MPPPPPPPADGCRAERDRYLRRLLYMAGIDVDDPATLLEALRGPPLPFGPFGVVLPVDPVHPLAWDLELRSAARDLVECHSLPPS